MAENVDYDALAQKAGAIQPSVDYDALAAQSGAKQANTAPGPWKTGYVAHSSQPKWADPNKHDIAPTMTTAPADTLKKSLGGVLEGVYNAVAHPITTAENLGKVIAGASPVSGPPGSWQHDEAQPVAQAVGEHYKQEVLHPLKSLNEDPLGTAADIGALAAPADIALRGAASVADVANAARTASGLRVAAKAAGTVSDYSNLPSVAGKALGYGLSKGIGAVTNVRSGLVPIESAAVDYALNDPMLRSTVDVGTATGNKAIGAQKSLLRKFPTSAGVMTDAEMAQKAAIGGKMADVAGNVAPGGPTQTFTAGQQTLAAIKQQLNDYSRQARDAFENRLYGAAEANPARVQTGTKPNPSLDPTLPDTVPVFENIAGPTDMRAIKATAKPMLDQLQTQMRATGTKVSPLTSMLEDIVNGPDVVSLKTAKGDISTIQSAARNEAGVMRTKAQALSSQLVGPYRDAIDDAAMAVGPDAYQALRDGNEATKAKYDLASAIPKSYMQRDVPPADLVDLHGLLTKNEDAQFPALEKVGQHVPHALPGIARATIEDIFRGTTEGGGISKVQSAINKWNNLGPQTKQLLFGPDTTEEITNLLQYAKMAVSESNPSGTAPTASIIALYSLMSHNPVAAVGAMVGARQLAKGIMSPEMAQTVRSTGRVPLPSPGPIVKGITAPINPASAYANTGRAVNNSIATRMGQTIAQQTQAQ